MILISKSPRRQEIMRKAGYEFTVIDPNISEEYPSNLDIEQIPVYLAEKKIDAVKIDIDNEILVACDTIVVLGKKIIGKPSNELEAKDILQQISNNVHKVITGVCIVFNDKKTTFTDESLVYFRKLKTAEIDSYIKDFKPFDKAGAYGIQEWIGLIGIEKIEGSFYNIMGLPIHKLYIELSKIRKNIEDRK